MQHPKRMLQPFSATKNHRTRTCRLLCQLHSSRSPDLRIVSSVRPSRVCPMTGFRLAHSLHAYSGGTVRDLHPVPYAPTGLLPPPQALKLVFSFYNTRIAPKVSFVNHRYSCIFNFIGSNTPAVPPEYTFIGRTGHSTYIAKIHFM